MNLYEEHIKRETEWQEIRRDFEKLKQQQAARLALYQEAARLGNRPIPSAMEEWIDLHERSHIAPWPEERKHEAHSLECRCEPTTYKDVIIHWDEQKTD